MAVNPAVALGGVGVVALGVVGGLYATGTGTAEVVEPEWRALSEDKGFWKDNPSTDIHDNYREKYAGAYGVYFLGVGTAKNDAKVKDNKVWWEKKYSKYFGEGATNKPTTGKFAAVKMAVSTGKEGEDAKSLNKICDAAYKATSTNEIDATGGENKFKEDEVWKYCSPIDYKPVTLATQTTEKGKYSNKIGSDTTHGSKFVSIEDTKNTKFWELRQKQFFATSGTFSGTNGAEGKFFKKFYNTGKGGEKTIKDKCLEAYLSSATATSGSVDPDASETLKFCSIEGK